MIGSRSTQIVPVGLEVDIPLDLGIEVNIHVPDKRRHAFAQGHQTILREDKHTIVNHTEHGGLHCNP